MEILISLILLLLIVGVVCWIIQTVPLPIPDWCKRLIIGLVILFALLYVLRMFGFYPLG
jgi:putative effector of murein hydrolase LrgA (UPF0299 family)